MGAYSAQAPKLNPSVYACSCTCLADDSACNLGTAVIRSRTSLGARTNSLRWRRPSSQPAKTALPACRRLCGWAASSCQVHSLRYDLQKHPPYTAVLPPHARMHQPQSTVAAAQQSTHALEVVLCVSCSFSLSLSLSCSLAPSLGNPAGNATDCSKSLELLNGAAADDR